MVLAHLTVAEVSERAHLGMRVAVCRKCFRRPPGSEALGADVPRSCQGECELFANLPRLALVAACVDPSLGPAGRPAAAVIERICGAPGGPGRGCPLSRYRHDVVRVLGQAVNVG
jgi:hypothetical protein